MRAEQTGENKVTAAKKERKEGHSVSREERNGVEWRREDTSEEGLLTLAVSQAICVTMLHVLLKGRSAGNRDVMVSGEKTGQATQARRP